MEMFSRTNYDQAFTGLENNGDNNCFLNVVIQSLFHLKSFRRHFEQRTKNHFHSKQELTLRQNRSDFLKSQKPKFSALAATQNFTPRVTRKMSESLKLLENDIPE